MANLLVVEDSPTVGRLLLLQLTSSGHSVRHALTIAAALDLLGDPGVELDLLLVDLVLPDGSGARLAQHCRREGRELPIIFMTGWPELPPALTDVGEWRVLNKPFGRGELAAVVQRALDEALTRPLSASAASPLPRPAHDPPAAATAAPRPRR